MLVIAWILLVVFVFGFVALCAFAVFMVPRWSAKRQNHFVACARFLVFRFRLVGSRLAQGWLSLLRVP